MNTPTSSSSGPAGSGKYPRTPHAPCSPGGTSDDRRLRTLTHLLGVELTISEKLDGSNVCLTRDALYARSHSGPPTHPSFAPLKARHAALRHQIPANVSVFAEWCFAVHSITYPQLPEHAELSVFAVRNDLTGIWYSSDDVIALAAALAVATAPELGRGTFTGDTELTATLMHLASEPSRYGPLREGIVVRASSAFADQDFARRVAKVVRADHVQTDEHWSAQPIRRHR